MNKLRVEVDPLSDERWARIERSLFARLESADHDQGEVSDGARRRFGPRLWFAVAAVLCSLAFFVVARPWSSEGPALDQPSRITTGPTASHLSLPGLALDVGPQSAVVVGAETTDGLLVVLDRGSIVCQVAKRSSTQPLIVQAGGARVRVVGTRFEVMRLGEAARVKVYEGVVEVAFQGRTARVAAGEEWPGREPSAPTSALVEHESSSDPLAGVRSTASATPAPARSVPVADDGGKAARPSSSRNASPSLPRSISAEQRRRAEPEPAQAEPPERDLVRADPESSQALFEQATALERSDPARAPASRWPGSSGTANRGRA
jgi:hypothetical protein